MQFFKISPDKLATKQTVSVFRNGSEYTIVPIPYPYILIHDPWTSTLSCDLLWSLILNCNLGIYGKHSFLIEDINDDIYSIFIFKLGKLNVIS